jgi:hypothetical protein
MAAGDLSDAWGPTIMGKHAPCRHCFVLGGYPQNQVNLSGTVMI